MLDSETRRKIDNLRDILVGKIPSPQSQVEQITTGLIYKFMNDMDDEAVEMDGVSSFFVDDYEKYSWNNLLAPKLGGAERVQLYSDAIENMYTNPTAPPLFREIFKNSFLPFKDPSTLNMFLKEIDGFHYSHSEKLGDAFEYLLSFMGSQGDAGQFRTPRHIINFIVEIVNPQKNETILDPACGTAGFLISSYRHILKQNTGKKLGDKLTAEERRQLGDNLAGYDISPDMTRISLVNMYLHQFANPQIHEYDTLSSEDRWHEYYDVILANPPFFSPKGGITPHSRFGVQSKRAEVLFVDYIMEHLKPNGRAGIVVPEGIIFQMGKAYKTLRKKLVEDCLVGVISLPAGVFQPYSGVKTSILVLDKELNQKTEKIFFAKVESDGFSLGAQRREIDRNDLPEIKEAIGQFLSQKIIDKTSNCKFISKSNILEKDFTLNVSNYLVRYSIVSNFEIVKLTDYADFQRGTSITKKEVKDGNIPVIAGGQKPAYFHNKENREANSITVSSSGYAGFVSFHPYPIFASDCFTVISRSEFLDQKFLFYLLKSKQDYIYSMQSGGVQPHLYARDFNDFEIPLPPIEVQQEIVGELDRYHKIIDGCRQVVENYKPTIDIDPSWEMIELGDVATTEYGTSKRSSENGKYAVLRMANLQDGEIDFTDLVYSDDEDDYSKLKLIEGDILFNRTNSPELVGKTSIFRGHDAPMMFAGYLVRVKVDRTKLIPEYLNAVLNSQYGQRLNDKHVSVSGNQANINATKLKSYPIPSPHLEIQEELVQMLEVERELLSGNQQLIEIYTQKIQNKIGKIWGKGIKSMR